MATHHGKAGTVRIGASAVAEIQSWSVTREAELAEDTAMGDAAKTYLVGVYGWSGQIECSWDETDVTGQEACVVGAAVTLNLYPEGTAATSTYWTGPALIEKVGESVPRNGVVSRTISFRGNGTFTQSTI